MSSWLFAVRQVFATAANFASPKINRGVLQYLTPIEHFASAKEW
jgi:hypothetical protein